MSQTPRDVRQPHSLRVRFEDMEDARAAIAALENAGLESTTMQFDETTRERAEEHPQSGQHDERFLTRALTKLVGGAATGIVGGAVIGFLVGLLMFGFGGTTGWLATTLGGAAVGAALGWVVGGIWRHKQSQAWGETFEAPDLQGVRLILHLSTKEEESLVREVLSEHDAEIERT